MDPVVWARVYKYWVEPNESNKMDPLQGYCQGTLRGRDLRTLKECWELTGDIINEVDRRIAASAPHAAFLYSTFLIQAAPIIGEGSECRRQVWTSMIGKGTDSQIGTARKTVIAPHFAPGHWCCATADLDSRRLVYYDPFCDGPRRTGSPNAQGA